MEKYIKSQKVFLNIKDENNSIKHITIKQTDFFVVDALEFFKDFFNSFEDRPLNFDGLENVINSMVILLNAEYKGEILTDFFDEYKLLYTGKELIEKINQNPELAVPVFHNLDTKNFIKVKLASEVSISTIQYYNKKFNKNFLKEFYDDFLYASEILAYCQSKKIQDDIISYQELLLEAKEEQQKNHDNLNKAIDKASSNATYKRETTLSKIRNVFNQGLKTNKSLSLEKK